MSWASAMRATVGLVLSVLLGTAAVSGQSGAAGQDALGRAKGYYASAEFEEALRVLSSLRGSSANTEAAAYEVYCLVALGRRDEAKTVVARIVRADPFFRPTEGQVAPGIRAFFEDARKPLLSEVARQAYAKARTALDRKDMRVAAEEFDRAILLFDEIGGTDPMIVDLRGLALNFRDQARSAGAPVATPRPDPVAPAASSILSGQPIYGVQDTEVSAPIPLSRNYPEWRPNFFELNHTFSGDIELVLGEDGKVLSASMVTSVHPRYDGPLLEAAKTWTFKPALRNGSPVKYRYVMTVRVLR